MVLLEVSQLSTIDFDSAVEVDSGSKVDSLDDLHYEFELEFEDEPDFAVVVGSVSDYGLGIGYDSATEEHFQPTISKLAEGNFE